MRRYSVTTRLSSLLATLALVQGCGQASVPGVAPVAFSPNTSAAAAIARPQYVYALLQQQPSTATTIVSYVAGTATIKKSLSKGLNSPFDLAVDQDGSLYVSNSNNTVRQYDPGATSVSLTLAKGLDQPTKIQVVNQRVYVLNVPNGTSGSISIFPIKSTSPIQRITKGLQNPVDFIVDRFNTVYVLNYTRFPRESLEVDEYDNGQNVITRSIPVILLNDGGNTPTAMAVNRDGTLVLPNENQTVSEYVRGSTTVSRTISFGSIAPDSGSVNPLFDADGNLYLDLGSKVSRIVAYHPGEAKPFWVVTMSGYPMYPSTMSLDRSGHLFVVIGDPGSKRRRGSLGVNFCKADCALWRFTVGTSIAEKVIEYPDMEQVGPIQFVAPL